MGDGLVAGLLGAGVAFALHFVMWQMKLEGAGDAKLMMGVGAILGWAPMLEATVWRYVLLLPYAVTALTVMRRWPNFIAAVMWVRSKSLGADPGPRPPATEMPFGPLIAVAVPLAIFTSWLDLVE